LSEPLERDFSRLDTFVIYMCLEGNCTITWEGKGLELYKGETLLVPAVIDLFELSPILGNAKLLEVYI
jgi:mannose-6-phosphate isomerase